MGTNMTSFQTRVLQAMHDGMIEGDGHTIFSPQYYAPHFSEEELRDAGLIQNFRSDLSDHKGTIFGNDGIVREELKDSVYNLDFLYWVRHELGIDEPVTMIGRGSQARQILGQIRQVVFPPSV